MKLLRKLFLSYFLTSTSVNNNAKLIEKVKVLSKFSDGYRLNPLTPLTSSMVIDVSYYKADMCDPFNSL